MATITDESMREMLPKAKDYSIVILRATAKRSEPGADKIVWEHGRRNFSLRADGLLAIVCPINDDSNIRGVSIFNANIEDTRIMMDEDPAVKAGIFVYEIHPARSFPGDCLPE